MVRYRLGEDFLILPLGLGLGVGHMLHFMGAYGGCRAFRADACGRFEGNAGIVGAVLVFAVLAGLAFVSVEISSVWDFPVVFRLVGLRIRDGFFQRQAGVLILWNVCCGNLDGIIESLLVERQ